MSKGKVLIGYSVDTKQFMVKVIPPNPTLDKVISYIGRKELTKDEKTGVIYVHPSTINSIKLENNIVSVAKTVDYSVTITEAFKAKKRMLESLVMSHAGENKIGERSAYEVKLKEKNLCPHLEEVMMPFQKDGFNFMTRKNGRVLLADDMGLGKTLQVIAFIRAYPSIKRILIVCPKSIKQNWDREFTKWKVNCVRFIPDAPPDKYDLSKGFGSTRVVIMNYEMVEKWKSLLIKWNPDMLVCDEIQYIKNPDAIRTKAVESVGHKARFVIGMTGTPVANSPFELFTISNLIRPKMFDKTNFNYTYCGGEGMKCRRAINAEELHKIMTSTIMLRRLKKDVLKELPPKRQIRVELEIDTKKYDEVMTEWTNAMMVDPETNSFTWLAKLREVTVREKLRPLCEWLDKFLEDTDRKIIVFTHHQIVRDLLVEKYKDICVCVEGRTKEATRQENVDKFQTDEKVRMFIGSILACSEGITLTAASDVCMAESIYNPKKMEQAEDRSHRKGQEEHVTIWNLVCMGTHEEQLQDILDEKRIMAAQIIDGATLEQAELSVEKELVYRLENMIAERMYK